MVRSGAYQIGPLASVSCPPLDSETRTEEINANDERLVDGSGFPPQLPLARNNLE